MNIDANITTTLTMHTLFDFFAHVFAVFFLFIRFAGGEFF